MNPVDEIKQLRTALRWVMEETGAEIMPSRFPGWKWDLSFANDEYGQPVRVEHNDLAQLVYEVQAEVAGSTPGP